VADDDGLHARQVLEPDADAVRLRVDLLRARRRRARRCRRARRANPHGREARARGARRRRRRRGRARVRLAAALGYARRLRHPVRHRALQVARTRDAPSSPPARTSAREGATQARADRRRRAASAVVLVDDSIVRGTTSGRIVQLLREAGATEVHFRVSSPPIALPVLLRHRHRSPQGSRRRGHGRRGNPSADRRGLALTTSANPGSREAIGLERTCLACFNGLYPAGHPGEDAEKEPGRDRARLTLCLRAAAAPPCAAPRRCPAPPSAACRSAPPSAAPRRRTSARHASERADCQPRPSRHASRTNASRRGTRCQRARVEADAPGPLEPQPAASRRASARRSPASTSSVPPTPISAFGRPRPRGGGRGRAPGPRRAPRAAAADALSATSAATAAASCWWSK
jgi:hypothetical protein